MFIKKFDHHYLKLIKDLDVQDEESKQALIEKLTLETIKKRAVIHALVILVTFGYHYFKLRMNTSQALEEAFSARKLNSLLSLKRHEDLSMHPSYKQIYSKRELKHLIKHPISEYQLLKTLYFQRSPLKYKKIWKSLFHAPQMPAPHNIDSINLYYDRLRAMHSVPHEQIMKHLKKKMEGRAVASLSAQELQLVFKELMDSQKAS